MNYQCHACTNRRFYLRGSAFSTNVEVHCNNCDEHIADFDQMDFIKE